MVDKTRLFPVWRRPFFTQGGGGRVANSLTIRIYGLQGPSTGKISVPREIMVANLGLISSFAANYRSFHDKSVVIEAALGEQIATDPSVKAVFDRNDLTTLDFSDRKGAEKELNDLLEHERGRASRGRQETMLKLRVADILASEETVPPPSSSTRPATFHLMPIPETAKDQYDNAAYLLMFY